MGDEQLVLGIETSCDETSAAVIKDGVQLLSNVISSQIDEHEKFGGVVPEIASRKHVEAIIPIIDKALNEAGKTLDDITAVAVTCGPGLVGGLLVGLSAAKAISLSKGIPLIGVHHIEGHLYANFLEHGSIEFPLLCLTVSGGHTELILMGGHCHYKIIGSTIDDAAGEAFDKVARILNLGYPGGPVIDRIAKNGNGQSIHFTRALAGQEGYDFSFSGIKTAVKNYIKDRSLSDGALSLEDITASFQESMVDMLVETTFRAAKDLNIKNIMLSGGVGANSRLRQEMTEKAAQHCKKIYYPSIKLCTDNAAMIGAAGYYRLVQGFRSDLSLGAFASLSLDSHIMKIYL